MSNTGDAESRTAVQSAAAPAAPIPNDSYVEVEDGKRRGNGVITTISTTTPSVGSSSSSPSFTAVVSSITFYSSVSLAIVYYNWWLFTSSFEFPVFVSWFQQVVGFVLFHIFGGLGHVVPLFSHIPCVKPELRKIVRVLPLSFNFVLMVAFANLCLKYVQISTYQVARSLTIFFTILLSYGILGQTQSRVTLMACGVMVLGFIIGSLDPSTLSLGGVITGACSSVFQAMYNVMIKTTLRHVDGNAEVMLYYNLLISSFMFLPALALSGEWPAVLQELPFSFSDKKFVGVWLSLVFSGVLATLMNLASYICVKVTSPLTFNIVGFTKSLFQSLGGVVFLGDIVSLQSLFGISLSLAGSGWYSRIKMVESQALQAKPATTIIEAGVHRDKGEGEPESIRIVVSPSPLMGDGKLPRKDSVERDSVELGAVPHAPREREGRWHHHHTPPVPVWNRVSSSGSEENVALIAPNAEEAEGGGKIRTKHR